MGLSPSRPQVPWRLAGLSPCSDLGTMVTGGTQSCHAPRYHGDWRNSVQYPGDWRDSVLSGPQVPWIFAGLSPFRPPGTLEWRDSVLSAPPGTLWTGGTQSFQPPRHAGDWRDSVLSDPQVSLGLAGAKSFQPPR